MLARINEDSFAVGSVECVLLLFKFGLEANIEGGMFGSSVVIASI